MDINTTENNALRGAKDQASEFKNANHAPTDNFDQELTFYKTSETKYLYIFNQKKFQNTRYFEYKVPPELSCNDVDVRRLSVVFEKLGYKVFVHDNLTYNEIMDTIDSLSKANHKDTSCLCFAILSHGDRGGEIYAADRPFNLQDMKSLLAHGDNTLVGKPKIFFVEACRGHKTDPGRRLQLDAGSAAITIPSYADFLVLYSTTEGYVSYTTISMINELCNVVEKYHKSWDILHITTLVQNKLAYNYMTYAPRDKEIHDKKQMAETTNALTKLFKF